MTPIAYLSGPMTGYKDCNDSGFREAAKVLRDSGLVVINPAENFGGVKFWKNAERAHYMKQDINHVLLADFVVVLDNWLESKGARIEVIVAFETGTPVYDFTTERRIVPFDLTMGRLTDEQLDYRSEERWPEQCPQGV